MRRPLLLALLLSVAAGALAPPLAAQSTDVRTLSLSARQLVYRATDGRIYASVGGSAPRYANRIVVVDPATATVDTSFVVGSEPGPLALSDDGSTLYVGLDGSGQVARVDLATHAVTATFGLGTSTYGSPTTLYAADIEVQPGRPDVVAVSLKNLDYSPSHEGVAIYEDGVRRPRTTPGHTGSNVIAFGATAERLYGYNNETTEFGFRRLAVSDSGVVELSVDDSFTNELISGFSTDLAFSGGRVFSSSGRVIDPEARAVLGTFALPWEIGNQGLTHVGFAPHEALDRTFFLGVSWYGDVWLFAYDNVHFARLAAQRVEGVPAGGQEWEATYSNLVTWGANGLAFATADGRLVLVRSRLFEADLAGFAAAVDRVDFGSVRDSADFAFTITNVGTAPLRVDSVRSSVDDVTFSPNHFTLAPGASLDGTARYRPRRAGYIDGSLFFHSNALSSPDEVRIFGLSEVVSMEVSERALDFGPVEVGTTAERWVSLSNTGSLDLDVLGAHADHDAFAVELSPTRLSPWGSTTLLVRFTPPDTGAVAARVVVRSTAASSPDTIRVQARGVRLPRIALSPHYVAFGDVLVGTTREAAITLHSVGTDTLVVTDIASTDAAFVAMPKAFRLAPGDSAAVRVRFHAVRPGSNWAQMRIESNMQDGWAELYVAANVVVTTDAEDEALPTRFAIGPNYPNPVRDETTVPYTLARSGPVRLRVFDVLGREAAALVDAVQPAGAYTAALDARALPAGTYVVRLEAGEAVATRVLTVAR